MGPAEFLIQRYEQATMGALGNLALSVEDRSVLVGTFMQMKAIVEWHQNWPTLLESPPNLVTVPPENSSEGDFVKYQVTQRISWLTQQEYIARFGKEPPTAPILAILLESWKSHPDYDPRWLGEEHGPKQS